VDRSLRQAFPHGEVPLQALDTANVGSVQAPACPAKPFCYPPRSERMARIQVPNEVTDDGPADYDA